MRKLNLLLSLCVIILTGCASAAKTVNMTVDPPVIDSSINYNFKNSIFLDQVTGGEDTNPLWTSEVGNEEFKNALKNSLNSYQYLSNSLEQSRYILNANLLGNSQPAFGFDMTVKSFANYTLIDRTTQKTFLAKTVESTYTATMGDAFAGVTRLRLATEGSVKKNITTFINTLNNHHN